MYFPSLINAKENKIMKEVVIVSGSRTPVGTFGGSLKSVAFASFDIQSGVYNNL